MPLRIGVVGAGHMGRIHLEKLSAMEGVEVAGVIDVDCKRTEGLPFGEGIPCFTDYREIIGRTDGIVIATPTESHYEIGKAFLESGSHVFMEKPVTSNPREARELIDLAEKAGRVFQVGHLERFNPVFVRAMSDIREARYIEARRVSPFTGRSTDVSVVLDIMIHDLDLVLSIVKDRVKEVKAQGFSFVSEKPDMANAWIEFENGCVANLTASRIASGRERCITIFEKDRYFALDLLSGMLTVASQDKADGIKTVEHETAKADAVKLELTEFIQSIKGETKPSVRGEDGLSALVLAGLIEQHIAARSST